MQKNAIYAGVLALVAIVIAIGGYYYPQVQKIIEIRNQPTVVGGVMGSETNYYEVGYGGAQTGGLSGTSPLIMGGFKTTLPAGSSYVCQPNPYPGTIHVTDSSFGFEGTGYASSTFRLTAFSTTTSSIASSQNFTALTGFGVTATSSQIIIPYTTYATSTYATTTSMVNSAQVQVASGMYICLMMQNGDASKIDASCRGDATGKCESATSTSRGFNPTFQIQYWR